VAPGEPNGPLVLRLASPQAQRLLELGLYSKYIRIFVTVDTLNGASYRFPNATDADRHEAGRNPEGHRFRSKLREARYIVNQVRVRFGVSIQAIVVWTACCGEGNGRRGDKATRRQGDKANRYGVKDDVRG